MDRTTSRTSDDKFKNMPRPSNSSPSHIHRQNGENSTEPKSDLLRDKLRERKANAERALESSQKTNLVPKTGRDDWIFEPEEEPVVSERTKRFSQARHSVVQGATRSTAAPGRILGSKETEHKLDDLSKQNFDLKLKIYLSEERIQLVTKDLEDAVNKIETLQSVERDYATLLEEYEALVARNKVLEDEKTTMKCHYKELAGVNDELLEELEARDAAVEEAAGIIHILEEKTENMGKQLESVKKFEIQQDLTTNHDTNLLPSLPGRFPTCSRSTIDTRPSTAANSDYFSAASASPNASSIATRPLSTRIRTLVRKGSYSSRIVCDLCSQTSLSESVTSPSLSSSLCESQPMPHGPRAQFTHSSHVHVQDKSTFVSPSHSNRTPIAQRRVPSIPLQQKPSCKGNGPNAGNDSHLSRQSSLYDPLDTRPSSRTDDDDVFSTSPITPSDVTDSTGAVFGISEYRPPQYPQWQFPGPAMGKNFLFDGEGLDAIPSRSKKR